MSDYLIVPSDIVDKDAYIQALHEELAEKSALLATEKSGCEAWGLRILALVDEKEELQSRVKELEKEKVELARKMTELMDSKFAEAHQWMDDLEKRFQSKFSASEARVKELESIVAFFQETDWRSEVEKTNDEGLG